MVYIGKKDMERKERDGNIGKAKQQERQDKGEKEKSSHSENLASPQEKEEKWILN